MQRKSAAIGGAHDFHDLAHAGNLKPQHIVDKDRTIHVCFSEAVGFGVQLRVRCVFAHAQRVQICHQMTTDAVGTDDHQRADTIEYGGLDLLIADRDTFFSSLCFDLFACSSAFFRLWPAAVHGTR